MGERVPLGRATFKMLNNHNGRGSGESGGHAAIKQSEIELVLSLAGFSG